MNKTLYLKLNQISEIHEKSVYLKDIAEIYSDDPALMAKCRALKIRTVPDDHNGRYVDSVITVLEKIYELDPQIQVNNLGETDFIIDFQKPRPPRYLSAWLKTAAVCLISFFGAAFAIMTFNNDVSVTDAFDQIYLLVTGTSSDGFTILEISYSFGLGLGIVVFFNHFAHWKITTDPTPLEVEMRLYEENVCKTLIQNAGRKESGVDVS